MTRRLAIVFVLAAGPVGADEKKPATDPALQGKWEVTAAAFNGTAMPALKGRTLVFGDDEFTTYDGDTPGRTLTFTLDPNAKPKQIDLTRPDGAEAPGIYSVGKDELKLCYAEPRADRPKKFESKAGDRVFLLVLKRVKEK